MVRGSSASRRASTASATTRARKTATRPAALRTSETLQQRKRRAARILKTLHRLYPQADCALHHRSAFELLVATILSAQCTDERVNMVTPTLFERYPDARALATSKPQELENLIRSTGFYRAKARNLLAMSRHLVAEHGGRVPDSMDALLKLPGVARKTANCVLGTWFRKNEGIVVDTHVGRLAHRLGLLSTAKNDKDAMRIEQDLMGLFPRDSWTFVAHALIWHGRQVCEARKPFCEQCALARDCPSAGRFR